ncbi:MAG: 4-hydroxy-3-methylbut-2-enyl diphosphate reductase, partial [Clostridia bacterium]|nr:4-hydroxy-3-methylbut-2-enyl diphosphate reductase [Clostridia bacterium]MDY5553883.1 4-hydroxy-3-methylbut-2-enyl diphosphate reductase [Blautia sp.]
MKVKVAETAGFCFGVKRAVDKVYELIRTENRPIYTLGPVIHNEEVVSDLASKGVQVLREEEIDTARNGILVIRSHGVGQKIYQEL